MGDRLAPKWVTGLRRNTQLGTRCQMSMTYRATIDKFFDEFRPEDSQLILDSTGPSLTRHYLALQAIGIDRLQKFQEVHTYSGGAFAYFGYTSILAKECRHPFEEYAMNLDAVMRAAHSTKFGILGHLSAFIKHSSIYNSLEPMDDILRYCFRPEHLALHTDHIPQQLNVYVASPEKIHQINSKSPQSNINSIFELLRYAVNVPRIYEPNAAFIDSAFHKDYRHIFRRFSGLKQKPCLFVTPWKSGRKNNALFCNPFYPINQKRRMVLDFISLLSNIPNNTYSAELREAFPEFSKGQ
jgi:hypothetical protein